MEQLIDEKVSTEKVRSCDGTTKRKNENEEISAKSQKLTAKGQKRRGQSAVSTKQEEGSSEW